MTRPEAEAIVRAFKSGAQLSALLLQEAIRTVHRKDDRRLHLPALPADERVRVNAVLLLNLGKAIGRPAPEEVSPC